MSEQTRPMTPGSSDAPEPITGAVARILSARELVINRGSDHGVTQGMHFEILAPEGEDIEDPDTGDLLGSVDRPKVAVRIVEVKPKLSVARTFRKHRRNVGGIGIGGTGAFSRIFDAPKFVTVYETLKTTEETWENLSPEDSYVSVGDPVRQVLSDRDDA